MIYDVAIIGGGPAGYTAAELAGKNGLKTILFEKKTLGGVCLNEGCIPTKTLLYSAKIYQSAKDSAKYGVACENVSYDLSKIIARKNKVVRKLVAGIRAKMAEAAVEVVNGEAIIIENEKLKVENEKILIQCNEQVYEAKKLILCTGSKTLIPPVPGLKESDFWTHREALENKEIPESLLIIGGGVIGIEFASFFNTLGTKVIVVEMAGEILGAMDRELSEILRNELTKKGIEFHLNTKVTAIHPDGVEIEKNGEKQSLSANRILVSVGRKPTLAGVTVNEYMQTFNPNIYACGDVTGFSLLAHTAVREAEVAVQHILGQQVKMSYKAIPGVVYTSPEVAGVGETEESLQKKGFQYIVKKLPMTYSGRFVAENEQGSGVCKIIEGSDGRILGVHLLGNPASEIIVVAAIAIEKGMSVEELKSMVFPHPTVGEIMKETLM
ncbi:MAG: dihydrolipoyl dehydrogenase [Dysgonamonadaceae bacterium]|jgi:dihydrolipoamide dehydrogenase|nr:dihydrolipoyl dehydrogenase [Dysgonamonadaceae bacterium]